MVPGLKITCTSPQAKIVICCQMPLVAQIAPKNCTGWFSIMLNPNLQSDFLSDHSRHTSFQAGITLVHSLKPQNEIG